MNIYLSYKRANNLRTIQQRRHVWFLKTSFSKENTLRLMAQQQPISLAQIYKQFTSTFSPTENPRDVVRFAKRRLSVDLKYGDVKKYLTNKSMYNL